MPNVNSKANGIMDAITSADLTFPNNRKTISITIIHPSNKFSTTVKEVFDINSLRSRIGLIKIPSGKFF